MNRKKLIIVSSIAIVLVVLLAIASLFSGRTSRSNSTITAKTDPVTGELIVEGKNKTPEKTPEITGPTLYGTQYIQPLFGDDAAFFTFRDRVLRNQFADKKTVKIPQDNISKKVISNDKEHATEITFTFFVDDKKEPYRATVKYILETYVITATFTYPDGTTSTKTENAFGSD